MVTMAPIICDYPVRVALCHGCSATHFGVANMWGWDGATGAPSALPAVNDILPLQGNVGFRLSEEMDRVAAGNTHAAACIAVISPTGDIP